MVDQKFLESTNTIVSKAGELLRKLSLDPKMRVPQRKGDGSPVTLADIEVSHFLVEELKSFGVPVVSEEQLPEKPPGLGDTYFLVDPLDGTKYFARGEDEFAVCVGLVSHQQPVYGAIFDPTKQNLFWAAKGKGVYRNGEKISHSGPHPKLRVYSSGFHKRQECQYMIEALNMGEISEKGSALKFCDIAAGEIDLYIRFGPMSEWDTAAAQIILEEANCELFELATMKSMVYGKANYLNRGVVACHKDVSQPTLEFLKNNLDRLKKKTVE